MRTETQIYSIKRTAMPGANLEGGESREKKEVSPKTIRPSNTRRLGWKRTL
jgi:hypothetical protein